MRSKNPLSISKFIQSFSAAGLLATTWLLAGSTAIVSQSAWAYFPGKVQVDNAALKKQPRADSPTIKTLAQGTGFNATDTPTNGYYYIRTATDLGWIDGASIGKSPLHTAHSTPQRKAQQAQKKQLTRRQTRLVKRFLVKAHGDYNVFSISDLNNATKSTSFSNSLGFGAEAMYFLDPLTAVGLRLDTISQSVSATDTSTSNTFDFNLSTLAVMVGVERIFWEDASYYISGNGYLGLASSKLDVTTAGTSYDFSGKPLTFLALIEGGWKIDSTFSLYAEAGYRLLNSSNTAGTPTPPDGSIIPKTVSLNFSGPVIGFGASARF